MTKRIVATSIAVLALAWGGFNWTRTDRACDRATDGRMHAAAITVVPRGWLPGDTTVCRP